MQAPHTLQTSRMILRQWREEDMAPFCAMCADPRVMEFMLPLSAEQAEQLARRFQAGIAERGWGMWAAEVPGVAPFIGYVGLNPVTFETTFTPAIEVGWRLAHAYWDQGYATEGARACLSFAFDTLHLDKVVAYTVPPNVRSQNVMKKLGMHHDPAHDFDHPRVPVGSPLRRHICYFISHPE